MLWSKKKKKNQMAVFFRHFIRHISRSKIRPQIDYCIRDEGKICICCKIGIIPRIILVVPFNFNFNTIFQFLWHIERLDYTKGVKSSMTKNILLIRKYFTCHFSVQLIELKFEKRSESVILTGFVIFELIKHFCSVFLRNQQREL